MHARTHQVVSSMCACFLIVLAVGCGDSAEQQGATATPDTSADILRRAGECNKDTDCDDDELCLASRCVNPNSSGTDGTDNTDGLSESDAVDGLTSTDGASTAADSTDGASDGSDSADGTSTSADGADGGGGSTSGQGSGTTCETSADCPGDEFCCDVGFGGYCESEASACYGPECSGDAECGEGRECCSAQAALPAYCAPIGGCYGPTCANDGDCGSDGKRGA